LVVRLCGSRSRATATAGLATAGRGSRPHAGSLARDVQADAPKADVHAANAGVVGVDEPGALIGVPTFLQLCLELVTHAPYSLPVCQYLGLASWGTMGNPVLTTVCSEAAGNSRDVELLPQGQLFIRLVDSDGNDVQRADTRLDAVRLDAVVVTGLGSFFGDGVSTMAALQVRTVLHELQTVAVSDNSFADGQDH